MPSGDSGSICTTEYPGDHRDIVPPDPISNSVVKSVIADDSVGFPHVKVGHYQVLSRSPDPTLRLIGAFLRLEFVNGIDRKLGRG